MFIRGVFLILFFAVFYGAISYSQSINQTDSQGRKQGEWVKRYPRSSVVQYQGSFKDDRPVGIFRYNYPSNKLKALIEHLPNSDYSRVEFYYENGQLMSKGRYKDMKKDSLWISFNEYGQLTATENYRADVLHGERKLYHIPSKQSDKSQLVISIYNYVGGNPDGEFVEYYPNQVLRKTGQFKDNKRDGRWVYYELNGNKMMEENYYQGKMHGWQIGYKPNGSEGERSYFYYGDRLEGKRLQRTLLELKKNGINPNGGTLSTQSN